jgi:sugar transferase (PEP-CTERM/EpsH1 system associated)
MTEQLRLLYFAPQQIWPANSGGRLRNYHLARHLAARSMVTFVEMCDAGEEQHVLPEDSGFARLVTLHKGHTYTTSKILRGLAGPTPITVLNCWSRGSASQLGELLQAYQFDTVQIEGVHLIEYLPVIRKATGFPAIIVDWHNIESEMMWRYAETSSNWVKKIAAKRTAKLIERSEDRLLEACATHTVTSERERQKLLARHSNARIQIIPNGIDTSFYSVEKIAEARRRSGKADLKKTILFVGSMDYHANVDAVTWFWREIWPEIAHNHPEIHFTIVGRDPAPEVRALASDRIHVTGTVDDVRPFYASALAVVVPLRSGSGTRLKILEAMAAGVPVVSTRLGAEGIEAEDDVHLLLADKCQEIAVAVGRLVTSPEMRVRLSREARSLVCKLYDWSIIGKQLYGIHADLARSRVPGCVQEIP